LKAHQSKIQNLKSAIEWGLMFRFILKRLLILVPMVLIVVSLTWGLIRLAPGNFYTGEKRLPPAIERNIRAKYGLDQPWYVQYGRMIKNVLRGDFGDSLTYPGQSVNSILFRTLPVSATLGILAYLLALIVGLSAGTIAALKQNSKWDYSSMALAMLGISLPNFVLGPLLVLVFSLSLYLLPPARWGLFPSRNVILPVLTLSAIYMAYIARLTRSGMLEVLRQDYVRTARAKGLSEPEVVRRHVFRGGILPVVSFTGPALAVLITGTVVVERIFALPGLGNYFINANFARDEPLIIGIVAFISILILIFNLLVDIAYGFIDPRIRY
jgi:oligopeptide transport system permease protein